MTVVIGSSALPSVQTAARDPKAARKVGATATGFHAVLAATSAGTATSDVLAGFTGRRTQDGRDVAQALVGPADAGVAGSSVDSAGNPLITLAPASAAAPGAIVIVPPVVLRDASGRPLTMNPMAAGSSRDRSRAVAASPVSIAAIIAAEAAPKSGAEPAGTSAARPAGTGSAAVAPVPQVAPGPSTEADLVIATASMMPVAHGAPGASPPGSIGKDTPKAVATLRPVKPAMDLAAAPDPDPAPPQPLGRLIEVAAAAPAAFLAAAGVTSAAPDTTPVLVAIPAVQAAVAVGAAAAAPSASETASPIALPSKAPAAPSLAAPAATGGDAPRAVNQSAASASNADPAIPIAARSDRGLPDQVIPATAVPSTIGRAPGTSGESGAAAIVVTTQVAVTTVSGPVATTLGVTPATPGVTSGTSATAAADTLSAAPLAPEMASLVATLSKIPAGRPGATPTVPVFSAAGPLTGLLPGQATPADAVPAVGSPVGTAPGASGEPGAAAPAAAVPDDLVRMAMATPANIAATGQIPASLRARNAPSASEALTGSAQVQAAADGGAQAQGGTAAPDALSSSVGRLAAAPPASSAPALPASVLDQVTPAVLSAAQTGDAGHRVSVSITPDQLGTVTVTVDRNADGTMSIQVSANQLATLDMLRRDQGELARALDQAGTGQGSPSLSFSFDGGSSGGWSMPGQDQGARPPVHFPSAYADEPAQATVWPGASRRTADGSIDVTA